MAEIRAKMSCVFRLEKWLLIDIRRMAGCFGGVWQVFFTKSGWAAEKLKVIYENRIDFK